MNSFENLLQHCLFKEGEIWLGHSKLGHLSSDCLRSNYLKLGSSELDILKLGALHEVALDLNLNSKRLFSPLQIPLTLIKNHFKQNSTAESLLNQKIFFIGKNCWPTPYILEEIFGQSLNWQSLCVFLDPKEKAKRLLSTSLVIKNPATFAVIADGSFYKLLDTRRLQLAAKNSTALIFLIRKKQELTIRSAASTRWLVSPQATRSKKQVEEEIVWEFRLVYPSGLGAQKYICEVSRGQVEQGKRPTQVSNEIGTSPSRNRLIS